MGPPRRHRRRRGPPAPGDPRRRPPRDGRGLLHGLPPDRGRGPGRPLDLLRQPAPGPRRPDLRPLRGPDHQRDAHALGVHAHLRAPRVRLRCLWVLPHPVHPRRLGRRSPSSSRPPISSGWPATSPSQGARAASTATCPTRGACGSPTNPAGRDFHIAPRDGVRGHAFVGGNAFLLELLAGEPASASTSRPRRRTS